MNYEKSPEPKLARHIESPKLGHIIDLVFIPDFFSIFFHSIISSLGKTLRLRTVCPGNIVLTTLSKRERSCKFPIARAQTEEPGSLVSWNCKC